MTQSADLSALRDERIDDQIPAELPEQGGGGYLVVLPQTLSLRLPANLMQCWEPIEEKLWQDLEHKIPLLGVDGQQRTTQRIQWSFDKDSPLTIVAPGNDELDGQPCPRVTITNIPRTVRGGYNKPEVPKVADATFLLRTSLAEPGTTQLTTPREWVMAMAKHAGEIFRVESGLSAFCNTEKVRYIGVPQVDPATKQVLGYDSIEDPSGAKGCGKRYYTGDFKHAGKFYDRIFCVPGKGSPKEKKSQGCNAYLRGFFQIEKFLPRG